MSSTSIEDLPEEVLELVFKLLPQETLKNVALTCRNWKQMVETLPAITWTATFDHIAYDEGETWVDSVLASDRKLRKVKLINAMHLEKNKTMQIFTRHGHHVKVLLLFSGFWEKFKLIELLHTMPNLEKVILSELSCSVPRNEFGIEITWVVESPKLSLLKTIEVNQTNPELLEAFKSAQIDNLKLLAPSSGITDQFKLLRLLLEFMATQKNLTSLALRSFDSKRGHIFSPSLPVRLVQLQQSMPFKLKKLSLRGMNQGDEQHNNLVQFVKLHPELEELELGYEFPSFVYDFVFCQCKHLKTLRLMNFETSLLMDLPEETPENVSITNFITDYSASEPLLKAMRRMPSIQYLSILCGCEKDVLEYSAESLSQLKHLAINFGYGRQLLNGLRFQALSSLTLINPNQIDWETFTRDNPGVTALEITSSNNNILADTDIQTITQNWKLQSLILNNAVDCTESVLGIVRNNCSDLKLLEINKNLVTENVLGFRLNNFWQDSDSGDLPSDNFNWDDSYEWTDDDFDNYLYENYEEYSYPTDSS